MVINENIWFRCQLCGKADILVRNLLIHLQQIHPHQKWSEFETWPDGGLVIIDNTLEPNDFQ